jgi:hypothetical protein
MIGYFPKPYPDELLYSIVARYLSHTLNCYSAGSRDLFGKSAKAVNFYLPNHIESLSNNIKGTIEINPLDFIENHTMYPFTRYFASEAKSQEHLDSMLGSKSHRFDLGKSGMVKNNFKYCIECVKTNRKKFGETYWQRSHNLPEVTICLKHSCLLKTWIPPLQQFGKRGMFTAEEINYDVQAKSFISNKQIAFERQFIEILNTKLVRKPPLKNLLIKKGYLKVIKGSNILKSEFIIDFKRYSKKYPDFKFNDIRIHKQVRKIISGHWGGSRPKLNLLLNDFLETRPDSENSTNTPTVVCINSLCNDYNKIISQENYRLLKVNYRKLDGYQATCPTCKIVFQGRSNSQTQKIKIIDYGTVTKNIVENYHKNGTSLCQIGKKLKLHEVTIKKILLGTLNPKKLPDPNAFQKLRDLRRTAWLSELNSKNYRSITVSRQKLKTEGRWLLKHDPDWITPLNKKYHSVKKGRQKSIIKFSALDSKVLLELKSLKRKINYTLLKRRISKQFFCLHLKNLKGTPISKLPKSYAYLLTHCEDRIQYLKRRIKNYLQTLESGSSETISSIVFKFKVYRLKSKGEKIYQSIIDFIENLLAKS